MVYLLKMVDLSMAMLNNQMVSPLHTNAPVLWVTACDHAAIIFLNPAASTSPAFRAMMKCPFRWYSF